MNGFWASLAAMPLVSRWAVTGAAAAGLVGAVVGLVIGLRAYVPTAGFAFLEIGVPSAILSAFLGLRLA